MADDAAQIQRKPIDKDAIRERYRIERDKRLRAEGNDQYIRIAGVFDEYLEDPYTPVTPRAPKTDRAWQSSTSPRCSRPTREPRRPRQN